VTSCAIQNAEQVQRVVPRGVVARVPLAGQLAHDDAAQPGRVQGRDGQRMRRLQPAQLLSAGDHGA